MTDFQLSSYSLLGYIRAALVAGSFTDLVRKGQITGIEYSGPGAYKVYISQPMDLNRLKVTEFLFLPPSVPPVALQIQVRPLTAPVNGIGESVGFDVRCYDPVGLPADPPDDTNLYIMLEESPY